MNSNAPFARRIAVTVSAIWAAVLFLTGLDLDYDLRRLLAYVPSLVGFAVVVFDLWLWKIPGVSKITGRPRIYGTWQAKLTPNANSRIPERGNWGPIIGAMVIEQTFWTMSIRFHTDQSSSSSTTAALAADSESKQSRSLYFTYANKARQEHNERSYPHHGTTLLQVTGLDPQILEGSYWTDRLTAGDITLTLVDRRVDRSASEAVRLAQQ
ncbi:hypothetical protein EDF28_0812 [Curtobacterium sp. PhB137]|uniref:Cap15 family cyclic dinucleotide receptor domain-containing protein n=1 Tax=Curtobacterium sp. PhB137 TaxID=2485182 RepID=UPI000F4D5774|nr:hypothetical protein [Curtobacterium sp. PhB137]RPE84870.1 hypothetical protein EDF28_0812 [Curtobacterium sp. PhB137]